MGRGVSNSEVPNYSIVPNTARVLNKCVGGNFFLFLSCKKRKFRRDSICLVSEKSVGENNFQSKKELLGTLE